MSRDRCRAQKPCSATKGTANRRSYLESRRNSSAGKQPGANIDSLALVILFPMARGHEEREKATTKREEKRRGPPPPSLSLRVPFLSYLFRGPFPLLFYAIFHLGDSASISAGTSRH